MLTKLLMLAGIANVAVLLASYLAGKITGFTVDATGGTATGLNYHVARLSRD